MSVDLTKNLRLLARFADGDLTETLARIEGNARGLTADRVAAFLADQGIEPTVLGAATEMKRLVGQINVTIHALGILLYLPHVLEDSERIEYLSLGAGNTGCPFYLETDRRVAEFKFINWRGGPESIRQNSVFKDFFMMAENTTPKRKYLYLFGTEHALRPVSIFRAAYPAMRCDYSRHDTPLQHPRWVPYGNAVVNDRKEVTQCLRRKNCRRRWPRLGLPAFAGVASLDVRNSRVMRALALVVRNGETRR